MTHCTDSARLLSAFAITALAGGAAAQVTSADFRFVGTNTFNAFEIDDSDPSGTVIVDVGNQSFDEAGGFEIVPFFRNARGGLDQPTFDQSNAIINANASHAGGVFTFDAYCASDVLILFGTAADVTSTLARTNFSVSGDSDFTIAGIGDITVGDNWHVELRDSGGVVVFEASNTVFGMNEPISAMGTLPAGDYTFDVSTLTTGDGIGQFAFVDLTLTVVPAPASLALLAPSCGLLLRRRR
ncbi:MAG: hypothetical protein KDA31_00060 [Phycisphaerales bacterium]|nr:hypothetical protein [Phycisphaerales bacterium]MCB9837318.1 hypothetical protein [Phycisphaera sp.]